VEPSARRDTISWDIVETKSCFGTLPLPDGSSAEKIASEPCFWKTAGGFWVWKASWNCA
jgi:hypothetical protein